MYGIASAGRVNSLGSSAIGISLVISSPRFCSVEMSVKAFPNACSILSSAAVSSSGTRDVPGGDEFPESTESLIDDSMLP